MKTFLYQNLVVGRSRSGITTKRVRVWQIKQNRLHYLGDRTYTFEDDFQAFWNFAKENRLVAKKWFVENPNTGGGQYGTRRSWESNKIAYVEHFA